MLTIELEAWFSLGLYIAGGMTKSLTIELEAWFTLGLRAEA